ncbi:MAG: 30S ribosomal protein S12 methylthiotransferase RimO, partial [Clostridia bacterium]|nr:30S ribosomal protein S12 methylthiotransferase RimO [Clostridia bacterium]
TASEGCDNRCTYCAIPKIRGRFRSRPIEELVEEARGLEELGVKELCLVAQDTTRYGLDLYGKYSLADLVRALTENTAIPWIRLLYCYPDKITSELLSELRDNPRLVKYMDIPIQHISDRVLSAMNRDGDGATIREAIARLRAAVPDITLRTTVIVGFPGETEEEFSELCEFVKEARFDRFGAFCYSPEEDTPAAALPDQLDEQEKQDRYDTVMATQLPIVEEKNAGKIGKKLTVLCEGYDPVAEAHYGRSEADAPDVDGKIYFFAPRRLEVGEFYTVKIEEAVDYDLVGRVILRKK